MSSVLHLLLPGRPACPTASVPPRGAAAPPAPARAAWRGTGAALALLLALAGCGGGGGSSNTDPPPAAQTPPTVLKPASRAESQRFLAMATFGPTDADAAQLEAQGYSAWIDAQLALPPSAHRASWEAADAALKAADPNASAGTNQVLESFWKQALTGPDQLRQRVAFAWSQILVLSFADGEVANQPRALAAWLDMLGTEGLTTYRQLLESVARHPLMGRYLTHLRNQKADPATGRVPDENFAREVMQLFSIGLVKLNADGTPQLVNGQPVETYGPADISGLARVFTGWSFACPGHPSNSCFFGGNTGGTNSRSDPDREFKPLLGYPQFHSTEAKTFLGVTVPAQNPADPNASLKLALDTLAAHPNVGPFLGRQLIQRLVTSNPSPDYVAAVSAVWADNGAGVRGDLKAVVKAILMHPEARGAAAGNSGKLREPVLRLAAYLRAFPHTSDSGAWRIGVTDDPTTSLGQTPLRAPSVFNFFRPGYIAPNSRSAAAGLQAPELQLLNESTVAGWVNGMRDNLANGVGQFNGVLNRTTFNRRDLQRDWSPELALADTPAALVDHVLAKLLPDAATAAALRSEMVNAVTSIAVPTLAANGSNQASVTAARRNRVQTALLLALASPEYLIQK